MCDSAFDDFSWKQTNYDYSPKETVSFPPNLLLRKPSTKARKAESLDRLSTVFVFTKQFVSPPELETLKVSV